MDWVCDFSYLVKGSDHNGTSYNPVALNDSDGHNWKSNDICKSLFCTTCWAAVIYIKLELLKHFRGEDIWGVNKAGLDGV